MKSVVLALLVGCTMFVPANTVYAQGFNVLVVMLVDQAKQRA